MMLMNINKGIWMTFFFVTQLPEPLSTQSLQNISHVDDQKYCFPKKKEGYQKSI